MLLKVAVPIMKYFEKSKNCEEQMIKIAILYKFRHISDLVGNALLMFIC